MKRHQQGQIGIAAYAVLIALVLLAAALGVARHYHAAAEAEALARKQAEQTLEAERDLRKLAHKASSGYQAAITTLQEKARANERKLRRELASGPDCTLPAGAGSVLRDIGRNPIAAAAGGLGTAPAQADPTGGDRAGAGAGAQAEGGGPVSCSAVAVWAQRNIDEVLKPNAEQLRQVQELYENTRRRLDAQPR